MENLEWESGGLGGRSEIGPVAYGAAYDIPDIGPRLRIQYSVLCKYHDYEHVCRMVLLPTYLFQER